MTKTQAAAQAAKHARALRKTLLQEHRLDVPYSALRAALLQLEGLNPHAQRQAEEPAAATPQAHALYDPQSWKAFVDNWMGEYDVVLKKTAYTRMLKAPFENTEDALPKDSDSRVTKTLYLVEDEVGCLEVLSLDLDSNLCISEEGLEGLKVELRVLDAQVPSVRKYGLPEYVQNTRQFFQLRFGMDLADSFELKLEDSQDDSGDEVCLEVSMPARDWNQLLRRTFAPGTTAADNLREWTGLHYRQDFDSLPARKQTEFMERFIASCNGEDA